MSEYSYSSYPTFPEVLAAVDAGVTDDVWSMPEAIVQNEGSGPHCGYQYDGVFRDYCEFGNLDSDRTIALLGSSYMQTWLPAFHAIGIEYDWKIIQFTKPGCTPIDIPLQNSRGIYLECDVYRAWAVEEIHRISPDVVFIDGNWDTFQAIVDGTPTFEITPDFLSSQLAATITNLQESGASVFVLGTIPKGFVGYPCLEQNLGQVTACNLDPATSIALDLNEISQATTEATGATFVDLIPFFCTDSACPATVNGISTYQDPGHISTDYALWLRDAFYDYSGLDSWQK